MSARGLYVALSAGALCAMLAVPSIAAAASLVFARVSDPPGRHATLQRLDLGSGAVREVHAPNRPVYDVAVSPDGRAVAYVTSGRPGDQIHLVGIDGSDDRSLVAGSFVIDDIGWTPDGERIVYSAGPFDRRGERQLRRSEIYAVAADGGEPERLTRDDHADFDPSVTPDGERIVFVRDGDLHSMAIDGSDPARLTRTKAEESSVEVSPDGRRIVYVRQGRRPVVRVAAIDGTDRVTIRRGAGGSPTWSPNGKRIVFADDRTGRAQLYTARPDGTGVERLLSSRFGDDLPSFVD